VEVALGSELSKVDQGSYRGGLGNDEVTILGATHEGEQLSEPRNTFYFYIRWQQTARIRTGNKYPGSYSIAFWKLYGKKKGRGLVFKAAFVMAAIIDCSRFNLKWVVTL
jgi:hypothetical protein